VTEHHGRARESLLNLTARSVSATYVRSSELHLKFELQNASRYG
jgi:hypothetical protein